MRLLLVCTGNLCRSPVAERLAREWASRSLGPAAAAIEIGSAGLAASPGLPMDEDSAAALVGLGGNPEGFLSRRFTPRLAESAELVLTMTRAHRREVLEASPRGLRRTFTLPEAADLLSEIDPSALMRVPLGERAGRLAGQLDGARARRNGAASDDIPDPIDQPPAVHHAVAGLIASSLRPLADVLFAADPGQAA